MSRDKQIEQGMGDIKVIIRDTIYSISNEEDRKYITEILRDAGYRRASDVAEEIFAEIDDLKRYILLNENIALKCKRENGEYDEEYWKGKLSAFRQIRAYIDAELKKKYIGKDTNVTTEESEDTE